LRVVHASSTCPKITYQQILDQLPRSYRALQPRKPELQRALAEISIACREHNPRLPILTAMVVSSKSFEPGRWYFESAHPDLSLLQPGQSEFSEDGWERVTACREAWETELGKLVGTRFPRQLISPRS